MSRWLEKELREEIRDKLIVNEINNFVHYKTKKLTVDNRAER